MHCIGVLFDQTSGLSVLNRIASGSRSVPDDMSTYDAVTRITAINAIDAAERYAKSQNLADPIPFVFLSAAEAGWPDVAGGRFVENNLTPGFMKRYLAAKRSVENRLLDRSRSPSSGPLLRPVIFRPSLIYSLDRPGGLPTAAAFLAGSSALRLPFMERPVSVQALGCAVVRALGQDDVRGVQGYREIDALTK